MGLREAKARLAAIQSERPTTNEFLSTVADSPGTTIVDLAAFAEAMGCGHSVTLKMLWDLAPVRDDHDPPRPRRGRPPGSKNREAKPVSVEQESIRRKEPRDCRTVEGRTEFREAVHEAMADADDWVAVSQLVDALGGSTITNRMQVRDAIYHWMRAGQCATNGKARGWCRYKWGEVPTVGDKKRAKAALEKRRQAWPKRAKKTKGKK